MSPDARQCGASYGTVSPVRCAAGHPLTTAATHPVEPFPGQHLPHHPVDLGPGDPWHLPPSLLQTQESGSAQQAWGDMVMPPRPRCGSRTRPAPRRSSPSRTPSQHANGSRPHGPRPPERNPPEHWIGGSGARCRPAPTPPQDAPAGVPKYSWRRPITTSSFQGDPVR